MCQVCRDWEAKKITNKEALASVGKLLKTDKKNSEHYLKVSDKILDEEVPFSDTDQELDRRWHDETHED